MPKIVPAILEATREGFIDQLSRMTRLPGVERVQVDFGDGRFVDHKTLAVTDMDVLAPTIHFEAHLMMAAPKDFLDYQICGFKTIIVHYEAYATEDDLLKALNTITRQGMEAGLAVKPETSVEVLRKFAAEAKVFSILSVHPGRQGGEFLPQSYERVEKLRKLCPAAIIEVDGGVSETNIKEIKQAGADLAVVGSAIVKAADMLAVWKKLNENI